MKKQLLFITILLGSFFAPTILLGQGNTCSNATPFCTKPGHTFTYANQTGESSSTTHSGPSYGCMGYTPNQSWFYLETTGAGALTFTISQGSSVGGTDEDVDFVCWGPYTAATFSTACSHLNGSCTGGTYNTTPNPNCTGGIVDCSYSINGIETCTIPASINNAAGLFYIIDVTNFSDLSGYISITAGASNLPTNCAIACPKSMTMLMDDYTTFTGASWSSNSGNTANGSTLTCSKKYAIWPSMPTTLTDPFSDILTPCLMVDFSPLSTNLTTHGSYTTTDGLSTGVVATGQVGAGYPQGWEVQDLWFFTDSARTQTITYCQNGKAYNATYTPTLSIQNCWDNTVLGGPQTLSAAGATCYTYTIPGGANMGDAYYTISPASGAVGITDTYSGWLYVDPSQLPSSTTYTVTYHFKGSKSCNMITSTFVFTTPAGPTVNITPSSTSICTGASTVLTATGTANTYTWSTTATTSTISVSPTNTATPTVYTVTGTKTSTGCITTATATVTVNPLPTVGITASPTPSVCLGSSTSFTASGASTYTWTASGNGGLSGTSGATVGATPTTTANATYTVNGTDGNGCKNSGTYTINVNPLPTISISPSSTAICSGAGSSTLTASGASTYTWANGATLSATTGSVVVATPTNTAAATVYTVTGTNANGCVNKNTVSITVHATPTISVVGGGGNSQTVCGGGLANATVTAITFTSNPSGSVSWINSNTGIGVAASGSGNIASYSAPGVASQQVGVITASSTVAGCTSTSSSQLNYTVTINPIPGETGDVITPAGCGLSDGTIIGASGTGGSTYSYAWNGGGFVASSSYTNAAGTYPLQIKDNVTGCIYSQNFTIPNAGAPTAATPTASAASVCVGGTITLTEATVGGVTYNWTEANGNTGTGDSYTITNIPASPNPYTIGVTATAANCTGASTIYSITINPLPNPSISASPTQICQGSSTTLSVTPTGAYSYQWGNGSGTIAGATSSTLSVSAADVYSVTVTNNSTNCSASTAANGTISVNPLPTYSLSSNSYTICNGGSQLLSVSGANTFTWTPAATLDNANIASPTASPTTTTVYSVTGTDANACANLTPATVTVNVNPLPTYSLASNVYTICNGGSQLLSVSGANTFTWTPAATLDNATIANPTASPTTTTVYSVTGTDANACTNLTPATVTVNVTSVPDMSLAADSYTICNGGTQTFSVSGAGNYVWTPSATLDNATIPNPTASPTTTTIYTVNGTASGCAPSPALTLTLTVNPTPPAPTYTGTTGPSNQYCDGSPTPLTVNSGTAPSIAVWYYNGTVVNVGSTFTPPASTYTAGSYVFSVIDSIPLAQGGCVSSPASANNFTVGLTVNPTPPAPTYTGTTNANGSSYCDGSPIPLTVNSGTAIAVWYYNGTVVNVGSTFTPPASTYTAGSYVFSVIDSIPLAQGGCVSSPASANNFTVGLTINPTPPAPTYTGTTGPSNQYCDGSPTPLTVNSGTAPSIAVWYYNGTVVNVGSTFTPPASTYTAGSYVFSVIDSIPLAQGGCVSSPASANNFTVGLTVNPTPTAPTYTGTTNANGSSYCDGSPIPLTVNSGTAIAVWYYNGTVVNVGSTFTPPASTYTAGSYVFSVIDSIPLAQGGCVSSPASANNFTVGLTINPTPSANLGNILPDSARCGQNTGGVSSISSANITGGTQPYHYQWYDSNGLMPGQTSLTLSNQGVGTYSLQIIDSLGCAANITSGSPVFTVPASAGVQASAIMNPNPAVGSVPLVVSFTNTTAGTNNSYIWSFGDGTGSTLASPTNTYTNAGTYTVMLTATNGPCKDSIPFIVIANIPTTITIPNIFTPNGDGVNDEFFIINTGMSSLNCDIFNRWGQLLFTITAPNQGWDGITPNGDKAPEGTYMYLLQAQGLDNKTYKQQGTVMLVR